MALGPSSAVATCADTPERFSYLIANSPRNLSGGWNSISFTDSEKRLRTAPFNQDWGSFFSSPQESGNIKQGLLDLAYPPHINYSSSSSLSLY